MEAVFETEYFEISIQKTVVTHKYCCICFSIKNLTLIPEEARIQSYIKKKISIPPGKRCCTTHILKNRIYEEDLGPQCKSEHIRVVQNNENSFHQVSFNIA